jgi:hypothetical protein
VVRSCFGEVGADLSTDILVRANFAKIIVQSISMDLTSLEKRKRRRDGRAQNCSMDVDVDVSK